MRDEDAKTCSLIAPDYEMDETNCYFSIPESGSSEDRINIIRLVVPKCSSKRFASLPHEAKR